MRITLTLNFLVFFTFLCTNSFAQVPISFQNLKITGSIVDQTKKPLDYASVSLIHLPDSVSVGVNSTDKNGVYEFKNIKPGKYFIKALMVGYDRGRSADFEVKDASIQVSSIILKDAATNLKEVNVTAKIPVIDQKADRTIVNVEQMNTAGDNALEVLRKAPGITLDKDDNIILKGKGGANIMIDGKLSYMSGTELTAYLKSLPGSVLSKIELISNPPSSFDAAGTAGFINLKLKRNKIQGINGNANLGGGYGKYEKIYGGVNLNHNIGKWSSYVRFNTGRYNSYNLLTLNRRINSEQYNQSNFWHTITNSYNYSAGTDFYINDKHTLGFIFKGANSPVDVEVNSNSPNYNAQGVKLGSVDMVNPQDNYSGNYAFNLNYRFKIDSTGNELGFDADYVKYDNDRTESFVNSYYDGDGNLKRDPEYLRNGGTGKISIYALKLDYTHFFNKTLKMETGLKSSWVSTANDVRFDALQPTGWVNNPKRTNAFNYKENINAGYISLNQTFKDLDIKAGLRAEQTIGDGYSVGSSDLIKGNYWKLFPTLSASYKLDKNNQFTASYRKSINRPSYRNLNPFAFYSDPYTAIQGNPKLQPSYANNFEFTYNLKSFRLLTISYATVNGAQANVIYQDDITKETISRPENLNNQTSLYFATGSPFNVTKWWNNNTEFAVSFDKTTSPIQGTGYNASKWSWSASTNNTFTLPKSYSLSLEANYFSPSISGLYRTLAGYQISAGAKKNFMNNNATISFRINDIFDTARFKANLNYNNVNTYWQNEWESRRFSISLNYKFGNTKIKTARNRKTGTSDEERRTN